MKDVASVHNVIVVINQVFGMFGLFFTSAGSVNAFSAVAECDVGRYNKFFHGMLDEGVYFAPSAFEAAFVSAAHSTADLDATLQAADRVMATLNT